MPDDKHFRQLVDSTIDFAIISLNAQGQIISWNIGAQKTLGYTESEILGQSGDLIFTQEDREQEVPLKERLSAVAKGRAEDERWHLRKDGSRFWGSGVMTPIYEDSGTLQGYAKIMRDLTERKQLEEALQVANDALQEVNEALQQSQAELQQAKEGLELRVSERTEELRLAHDLRLQLLRRLVNAQEDERRRLSRELHDQMGQQVTALLLGLMNMKNLLSAEAASSIVPLQAIGQEIAEEIHHISFGLRPTALDDLGLLPALRNYINQWSSWNAIPIEINMVGWEDGDITTAWIQRLSGDIETTIYRIVQEILTNVTRHAKGATEVSLLLQRGEKELRVIVEDNGPGFNVEAAMNQPPEKRRLGLFGMQERAVLVGGKLSIESEPGQGTSVFLIIPL